MKKLMTAFLLVSLVVVSATVSANFERIIGGPSTVSHGDIRTYMTLCTPDETFDWSVIGSATLLSPPNSMNATIRFNYPGTVTIKCVTSTGEVMTKVVTVTSSGGGGNGGGGGTIDFEKQ